MSQVPVKTVSDVDNVMFVSSLTINSTPGMVSFIPDDADTNSQISLWTAVYDNRFDTPRNGINLRVFLFRDSAWIFSADALRFLSMTSGGSRLTKISDSDKGTVTVLGSKKDLKAISLEGLKTFIATTGRNSNQLRRVVAQNLVQALDEAYILMLAHELDTATVPATVDSVIEESEPEQPKVYVIDLTSDRFPQQRYQQSVQELVALMQQQEDCFTASSTKSFSSTASTLVYSSLNLTHTPDIEAALILLDRITRMSDALRSLLTNMLYRNMDDLK
jgi:hypothetical protein